MLRLKVMKIKHWLILFGLVLFVVIWSIFLSIWPPSTIVAYLGIRSSFLVMFLVSVFGGVSTFTSASYLATLATFAAGGLNPLALGLITGTGLFISDSFFFYLGTRGRRVLTGKPLQYARRVEKWFKSKPDWIAPVATYVYTGLTPLPNDVCTLTLAFLEIRYRKIFIALWLGNMTLTTIVAYLVQFGLGI